MTAVRVVSFGYRHGPAPLADVTIDARRLLRNPHADPAMRDLTGLDEPVRKHVLATPGALQIVQHTVWHANSLTEATGQPITIAIGCAGGRHRSVALAEEIGRWLAGHDLAVTVTHRDVAKPVLPLAAPAGVSR